MTRYTNAMNVTVELTDHEREAIALLNTLDGDRVEIKGVGERITDRYGDTYCIEGGQYPLIWREYEEDA